MFGRPTKKMEDKNFDIALLVTFCHGAVELLADIEEDERKRLQDHIKEQRRLCRSLPQEKTRPTWTGFCNRVSASHFCRQFRMSRSAFTNLCTILSTAIGEETFHPEYSSCSTGNAASLQGRGGLIAGEVKVAISLRILAGGSYLDLMPLFDVSVSHIYVIFEQFLSWVGTAFNFPLHKYLHDKNWPALATIAENFSYGSNGVFSGIIGAIDGLAIRIRSPRLSEVTDPGNYYCRKGFYALNVQAICDRSKKFTWCYPSNKGSTHDSVAFSNSTLHSLLTASSSQLEDQGFYLVGDSAYNLTPFLLVPYSTDEVRSDGSGIRDSFNFFLSSSRIFIECAFGELVMRWGILWRTLHFDLCKCQKIVQVCMLLHNHIKEENNKESNIDTFDDSNWRPREDSEVNGERAFPLVADNNEQDAGGRPSSLQEFSRRQGEALRRSIAVQLQVQDMHRPLHSGMCYNEYGHVFFNE